MYPPCKCRFSMFLWLVDAIFCIVYFSHLNGLTSCFADGKEGVGHCRSRRRLMASGKEVILSVECSALLPLALKYQIIPPHSHQATA